MTSTCRIILLFIILSFHLNPIYAQEKLYLEFDTTTAFYKVIHQERPIQYFKYDYYFEKTKLSEDSLHTIHYCYEDGRSFIEEYNNTGKQITTCVTDYVSDLFLSCKKNILTIECPKVNPNASYAGIVLHHATKQICTYYQNGQLKDSINTKSILYFFLKLNDGFSIVCTPRFLNKYNYYGFYLFDDEFNFIGRYENSKIEGLVSPNAIGFYNIKKRKVTLPLISTLKKKETKLTFRVN